MASIGSSGYFRLTVITVTTTGSIALLLVAMLSNSVALAWVSIALLAIGRGVLLADHHRANHRIQGTIGHRLHGLRDRRNP